MAELLAILSSLAQLPVRQDVAITGSVDQRGRALPVGGVTEKVEGFFDLCAKLGLTGKQGVVIPQQNVRNLVLRNDVLAAIDDGTFHIWSVDTVDEAVSVFMDMPSGAPDARPSDEFVYPEGSAYHRIQERLERLLERQRRRHREASASGSG
jgi:predicted ATP-dependent protease